MRNLIVNKVLHEYAYHTYHIISYLINSYSLSYHINKNFIISFLYKEDIIQDNISYNSYKYILNLTYKLNENFITVKM
jgi:hypothetical protein